MSWLSNVCARNVCTGIGLWLALAAPRQLLAAPGEPTAALPAPIAQALEAQGLPASALSVWVQALDKPSPRLSHLADTPRRMASVMKLVTTGVALRTLGPAYTWQTAVMLDGQLDSRGTLRGDVIVKASGDPSLDGARLLAWLQQLRDAGLRNIRGDVKIDRSVFALPPHDPAAFDGQPLKPYNAGPDAWLLAHGAVSLQFRPDASRAGRVRVALTPGLDGIKIDNSVRLDEQAACGDWRAALEMDVQGDGAARTVQLRGRYPRACGAQSWPVRWPEKTPGEHSAHAWRAAWQALGGRHQGRVTSGVWPSPDTQPWLTWTSPPLAEVIRDINKFSNNVMARQLFLALARPTGSEAPATLAQAQLVASAHVRQATTTGVGAHSSMAHKPCEGDALLLDNGSGLSRIEGASAHCMGSWIAAMWADPLMPEFLASLPIASVDGTARRIGAVAGRAHLKTGSLDDVMAVAGVVQTPLGLRQVVVAVMNDPKAESARPVIKAVLEWAGSDPVQP